MKASHITSIGVAVPEARFSQQAIADTMADLIDLDEEKRKNLQILYRATGIKYRHSVIGALENGDFTNFYLSGKNQNQFPDVAARMEVYKEEAIQLSLMAIENALSGLNNFETQQITHLITVSCTGMYAPGLDIEIIEHLKLNSFTQRTAVNFMGCYGVFNGLKLADAICKAEENAKVLLVSVELCSLHLQKSEDPDDLLAASIFADGAAAAIIESMPSADLSLSPLNFYCDLYPQGREDMVWEIGNFGFEMKLSAYVPGLLGKGINTLVENLLNQLGLKLEDIHHFAIHPGGKKILAEIEQALALQREQNEAAYQVLRSYGNMSSATILFVIKEILENLKSSNKNQNLLGMAFGPGLTMESMLLRVC
ncbi:type III polyketide synthase [Flexithrix dorotheae]|uniref:type III polyketide synthase n=1 Tax=Flexithrix dorotheae TaxID=70993 RepID=UPI0003684F37|nr:type III polyketide synthase [Flexithrix dorotheae]